jgi:hypothetical protein
MPSPQRVQVRSCHQTPVPSTWEESHAHQLRHPGGHVRRRTGGSPPCLRATGTGAQARGAERRSRAGDGRRDQEGVRSETGQGCDQASRPGLGRGHLTRGDESTPGSLGFGCTAGPVDQGLCSRQRSSVEENGKEGREGRGSVEGGDEPGWSGRAARAALGRGQAVRDQGRGDPHGRTNEGAFGIGIGCPPSAALDPQEGWLGSSGQRGSGWAVRGGPRLGARSGYAPQRPRSDARQRHRRLRRGSQGVTAQAG